MTSVVVAEGLPVLLRCRVHGDGPVQVVWRKNAIGLEQSPRVLQTVLDTSSPLEFSAELRINFSEKSDSAQYHCIGFNQYGRDEDTISLLVKGEFFSYVPTSMKGSSLISCTFYNPISLLRYHLI